MTGPLPGVSVVMPVLNEELHLSAAVGAVLSQDYPGELEIVLALGPSRDATAEVAARLRAADRRIAIVDNPSGATPTGLNAAIATSLQPIVARVDGHALLPAGYLKHAVEVLLRTGAANVGGIMAAEGVTPFEQAVAASMTSRAGVGNAPFHAGGPAGPVDTVYLGVLRREVLELVGGYDESFLRAQDWELNHRIRAVGGIVWFDPKLRVTYRPRPTLSALARQYHDYGRWRRVVMRRHPDSVRLRYLTPPAALLGMAGGMALAASGRRLGLAVPAAYAGGVLAAAMVEGRRLPWQAAVRLPVVLATMHNAWAAGFLTSPRRLGGAPSS